MADDHECAAVACEPFFQPFNRSQIKMVRRLIQKQQVRLTRQCTANRGAAFFAAACGFGLTVQIDTQLVGNGAHRIFGRPFFAMNGKINEPCKGADIGVLLQHHDVGAGHNNTVALIGLDRASHQFHQRRFASTIAANKR